MNIQDAVKKIQDARDAIAELHAMLDNLLSEVAVKTDTQTTPDTTSVSTPPITSFTGNGD